MVATRPRSAIRSRQAQGFFGTKFHEEVWFARAVAAMPANGDRAKAGNDLARAFLAWPCHLGRGERQAAITMRPHRLKEGASRLVVRAQLAKQRDR